MGTPRGIGVTRPAVGVLGLEELVLMAKVRHWVGCSLAQDWIALRLAWGFEGESLPEGVFSGLL